MFGIHAFGAPMFAQGYAVVTAIPVAPTNDLVEVSVTFHRTIDAAVAYARSKEADGMFAKVVEAQSVFGPRVVEVEAIFTPGVHVETER